jgi:hemolysin activation/secretion protein
VALQGLVAGQYSGDVLPPAEKFFLGGARYNRGFYAGEVTGDTALVASGELQFNTGLSVHLMQRTLDLGAQFYGFYDWGETWERQDTDLNKRLVSAGGGLRLTVTRYTEFDLEGVSRITRQPQGSSANVTPLSANAFYWRVLTRF